MRVFNGVDEFREQVGQQLGVSDWVTVEQTHVDQFADATGDHQWIHVDEEKAAAGPFGTRIVHGFLTLSLLPVLIKSTYDIANARMGINYGLDKVRFTSVVPVGSRVRGVVDLIDVTDAKDGSAQVKVKVTVEIEGSERPALIAEWLTRQYV